MPLIIFCLLARRRTRGHRHDTGVDQNVAAAVEEIMSSPAV